MMLSIYKSICLNILIGHLDFGLCALKISSIVLSQFECNSEILKWTFIGQSYYDNTLNEIEYKNDINGLQEKKLSQNYQAKSFKELKLTLLNQFNGSIKYFIFVRGYTINGNREQLTRLIDVSLSYPIHQYYFLVSQDPITNTYTNQNDLVLSKYGDQEKQFDQGFVFQKNSQFKLINYWGNQDFLISYFVYHIKPKVQLKYTVIEYRNDKNLIREYGQFIPPIFKVGYQVYEKKQEYEIKESKWCQTIIQQINSSTKPQIIISYKDNEGPKEFIVDFDDIFIFQDIDFGAIFNLDTNGGELFKISAISIFQGSFLKENEMGQYLVSNLTPYFVKCNDEYVLNIYNNQCIPKQTGDEQFITLKQESSIICKDEYKNQFNFCIKAMKDQFLQIFYISTFDKIKILSKSNLDLEKPLVGIKGLFQQNKIEINNHYEKTSYLKLNTNADHQELTLLFQHYQTQPLIILNQQIQLTPSDIIKQESLELTTDKLNQNLDVQFILKNVVFSQLNTNFVIECLGIEYQNTKLTIKFRHQNIKSLTIQLIQQQNKDQQQIYSIPSENFQQLKIKYYPLPNQYFTRQDTFIGLTYMQGNCCNFQFISDINQNNQFFVLNQDAQDIKLSYILISIWNTSFEFEIIEEEEELREEEIVVMEEIAEEKEIKVEEEAIQMEEREELIEIEEQAQEEEENEKQISNQYCDIVQASMITQPVTDDQIIISLKFNQTFDQFNAQHIKYLITSLNKNYTTNLSQSDNSTIQLKLTYLSRAYNIKININILEDSKLLLKNNSLFYMANKRQYHYQIYVVDPIQLKSSAQQNVEDINKQLNDSSTFLHSLVATLSDIYIIFILINVSQYFSLFLLTDYRHQQFTYYTFALFGSIKYQFIPEWKNDDKLLEKVSFFKLTNNYLQEKADFGKQITRMKFSRFFIINFLFSLIILLILYFCFLVCFIIKKVKQDLKQTMDSIITVIVYFIFQIHETKFSIFMISLILQIFYIKAKTFLEILSIFVCFSFFIFWLIILIYYLIQLRKQINLKLNPLFKQKSELLLKQKQIPDLDERMLINEQLKDNQELLNKITLDLKKQFPFFLKDINLLKEQPMLPYYHFISYIKKTVLVFGFMILPSSTILLLAFTMSIYDFCNIALRIPFLEPFKNITHLISSILVIGINFTILLSYFDYLDLQMIGDESLYLDFVWKGELISGLVFSVAGLQMICSLFLYGKFLIKLVKGLWKAFRDSNRRRITTIFRR